MLAPTRSSAEVEKLLGADFQGILSSDCYSAYFRQSASAKQKCLAHLERELESLKNSRFEGNRQFAQDVLRVLEKARTAHYHYHAGILNLEQLASTRTQAESQLQEIFQATPKKGWPYDAQRLINRLKRHWDEWFTFLTIPEVKPDNNDAERALRPIVIHRKVSGGARSDWGAELVTQMFSFLETMRLQGENAIVQLCELLSLAGRSPPGLSMT
jgi:hypothetical protein